MQSSMLCRDRGRMQGCRGRSQGYRKDKEESIISPFTLPIKFQEVEKSLGK